jgi:hypothetical protein
MPFKSTSQQRLCFKLRAEGRNGSWDCKEWAGHTNFKKLPKHKKPVKRANLNSPDPLLRAIAAAAIFTPQPLFVPGARR